jgi:hypothetical protein
MYEVENEAVYNLLVDGDGTYTVNDLGTTSVIGDGGKLVKDVSSGIITTDDAQTIFKYIHDLGGDVLNAWYIANK